MAAEAALTRADYESDRVRNDLLSSLADDFSRYQTATAVVNFSRDQILPDEVRICRAIYERYQQDPDSVAFNDVVTAQQTLASSIAGYLQSLGDQWQANADLSGLLQVDDIGLFAGAEPTARSR